MYFNPSESDLHNSHIIYYLIVLEVKTPSRYSKICKIDIVYSLKTSIRKITDTCKDCDFYSQKSLIVMLYIYILQSWVVESQITDQFSKFFFERTFIRIRMDLIKSQRNVCVYEFKYTFRSIFMKRCLETHFGVFVVFVFGLDFWWLPHISLSSYLFHIENMNAFIRL